MDQEKIVELPFLKVIQYQPGDGTRYVLAFGVNPRAESATVGFEGMRGGGLIETSLVQIVACADRLKGKKYPDQTMVDDYFVAELTSAFNGRTKNRCNPWTAVAIIQAFPEVWPDAADFVRRDGGG